MHKLNKVCNNNRENIRQKVFVKTNSNLGNNSGTLLEHLGILAVWQFWWTGQFVLQWLHLNIQWSNENQSYNRSILWKFVFVFFGGGRYCSIPVCWIKNKRSKPRNVSGAQLTEHKMFWQIKHFSCQLLVSFHCHFSLWSQKWQHAHTQTLLLHLTLNLELLLTPILFLPAPRCQPVLQLNETLK